MSDASGQTPVVIDTMVLTALLDSRPTSLGPEYRKLIGPAPTVVSFVTMAEIRYGALKAGWGYLRRRRLERDLTCFVAIKPDDHLIDICARLRHSCEVRGHPLGQKIHEADRWIAATALALEIRLVSDDGVFATVEGLRVMNRA